MGATKTKDRAAFKVAFITGATIFIMGYMNAFALHDGLLGKMVTPQTGNVVWMGVYPVFGEWAAWASALLLFFGFVFGCGFAVMTNKSFANKTAQFFFNWLLFATPAALYPFYSPFIPSQVAFLMMGLSVGVGVGFFRIMYHLDQINNAMATGSVRFIGVFFAEVVLKKNKKETFTLILFIICVLLFALGGTAWAVATRLDSANIANFSFASFALVVFCIIPMFFAPKGKA